jgi:hypothetical protein
MSILRPCAPSPREWPLSPDESVSRIMHADMFTPERCGLRVRVLAVIGELLDGNLLVESEVVGLFEIAFKGDREVAQLADLIDSRPSSIGKARFLKLLLSISHIGYATPSPSATCYFPHAATPFVELPSAFLRSVSPPVRFPTALRPPSAKLNSIQEKNLIRGLSEEGDPKLSPSTNVGSSIDISPPSQVAGNKAQGDGTACTVCRE